MMRLLQKLILTVAFLLIAAVGLDCLFSNVSQFGMHPVLGRITGFYPWPWEPMYGETIQRLLGLALVSLPLLYLAAGFAAWQGRPGAYRVETNDGELLLLDPGALIKFARLQIENHPAVVSQRVRVRQSGSSNLEITAYVSVRPIQSLPAIRHSIEKAVRDGFAQVMGIDKIDQVRVILGLDDKSLTQRPGVTEPPEPKPEPPVRASVREWDERPIELKEEPTYAMEDPSYPETDFVGGETETVADTEPPSQTPPERNF